MKTWQALFLKELKDQQGTFAFLLLAAAGLGAYVHASINGAGEPQWQWVLVGVPYLMALVFPFLLVHSFSSETRGQTHYLLLSLPVPRWTLVLAKYAAVLTGSAALFVLATFILHLTYLRLVAATLAEAHGSTDLVRGLDFWALAGCGYFSITVLLLGIATLVAGVKLAVRRFQGLAATVCFLACVALYARFLEPVVQRLGGVGSYHLALTKQGQGMSYVHHVQPELQVLLYSCFMGLVFLGLGTWLIDRRVEA